MSDVFESWFDNTFGDSFIDQSPRAIARQAWNASQGLAPMDAQRYRWLRRFDHFAAVDAMLNGTEFHTVDAAVDAAILAEGRGS